MMLYQKAAVDEFVVVSSGSGAASFFYIPFLDATGEVAHESIKPGFVSPLHRLTGFIVARGAYGDTLPHLQCKKIILSDQLDRLLIERQAAGRWPVYHRAVTCVHGSRVAFPSTADNIGSLRCFPTAFVAMVDKRAEVYDPWHPCVVLFLPTNPLLVGKPARHRLTCCYIADDAVDHSSRTSR